RAWGEVAAAAKKSGIAVILGTERLAGDDSRPLPTALVIDRDGSIAGFQDKTQLDPSEEALYAFGEGRRLFEGEASCGGARSESTAAEFLREAKDLAGGEPGNRVKFGVVICHEGWRYPETVRWAAHRGAQIVFHPHYHWAEPGGYVPTTF